MTDYIVVGIIILVVGAAIFYIIREKKKGKRCIGCPYASSCSSQGGCSSCESKKDK